MTRHTPKKLACNQAFSGEVSQPEPQGPNYIRFYKAFVAAIETIFRQEAKSLRRPTLTHLMMVEDGTLEITFAAAHGLSFDPNGSGYLIEPLHRPSNRVFEPIFDAFRQFAFDRDEIMARNIYEGVFELEISDPGMALQMLEHYLAHKRIGGCDPKPGEILGHLKNTKAHTAETLMNCTPVRPFASAAEAREASCWVAETHHPYLFSLNYLKSLLLQARSPSERVDLPDDLAAFRLQ